jgi:hypothetical protein
MEILMPGGQGLFVVAPLSDGHKVVAALAAAVIAEARIVFPKSRRFIVVLPGTPVYNGLPVD